MRPHAHHPDTAALVALRATIHCLTGCAIGEVLGMVAGNALGWSDARTIVLSVMLAFAFGWGLTMLPLRRAGMAWAGAIRVALAADTLSIAIMEIVDNAVMVLVPGAMDAPLTSPLFWGSLAGSLVVAGLAAWPANLWLVRRGQGHARLHALHGPADPHGNGQEAGRHDAHGGHG